MIIAYQDGKVTDVALPFFYILFILIEKLNDKIYSKKRKFKQYGVFVFRNFIPENAQKLKDTSIQFVESVKSNNFQNAQRVSDEASNILMNLVIDIRKGQDNGEFSDFDICDKNTSYYIKNINSVNKTVEDIWVDFKNNPNNIDYSVSQNLTIRRFANVNAHGDYVGYYIDNNDNHWLCFKNKPSNPSNNAIELIIVNIQKVCDYIITNI